MKACRRQRPLAVVSMGLSDHSLISEFRTPGPESGDIVARRWSIHRESSGINEQASARKHSIAFEAKSLQAPRAGAGIEAGVFSKVEPAVPVHCI